MAWISRNRGLAVAMAAGVCLAAALAGCSDDAGSGSGPQATVHFVGHTGLKSSMDKVIGDFEAANPGIKIEAQYVPAGPTYGQTLITQIQSGNAPDVFYGNGGTGATESLIPLAKSGKLLDLSDQAWVKNMPEQAAPLYQVDGKTYGLLMDMAPHGILYNVANLKAMSIEPPKTFDDVLAICAKAKDAGKVGIAFPGQQASSPTEIIAASTVYGTDPDWNTKRAAGQVTFAGTAGWQDAFGMVKQMSDAGCFQAGWQTASTPQSFEPLTAGTALMTIVPSGALGSVANGKPDEWAVAPFPAKTEADTRVAIGYQDGLAVSAETTQKDAALKFLDYVAGPGAATRAKLSGTVTIADAKAGTLPSTLTGFQPFISGGKTVSRPHDTWPGGSTANAMNTAVVAAVTGQQSVADALKAVDDAWGKS